MPFPKVGRVGGDEEELVDPLWRRPRWHDPTFKVSGIGGEELVELMGNCTQILLSTKEITDE
jgi:hypothetical protein